MDFLRARDALNHGAPAPPPPPRAPPVDPYPDVDSDNDSMPDLVGSDDDDDPLPIPSSRPTRPQAHHQPPPPPPPHTGADVDEMLSSSTLTAIADALKEVFTFLLIAAAVYLALTLLHYALPYPVRFLRFALLHLERWTHTLIWLLQYLTLAVGAALSLGVSFLSLTWAYFRWGETGWERQFAHHPIRRLVLFAGAALLVLRLWAPWWIRWPGYAVLAVTSVASLDGRLLKGVLHPRRAWRDVKQSYWDAIEEDRRIEGDKLLREALEKMKVNLEAQRRASAREASGESPAAGGEAKKRRKKKKPVA